MCICLCVSLYLLHIKYQHSNRIFLQNAAILAGPQNFRGLFAGQNMVNIGFYVGVRELVGWLGLWDGAG